MAAMHENVVELHQISNVNANCVIKSTTECMYCTTGVAGGLAVQVVAPLCKGIFFPSSGSNFSSSKCISALPLQIEKDNLHILQRDVKLGILNNN